MTWKDFLGDRILLLVLNLAGMAILAGFLYVTGYYENNILLILVTWLGILTGYLIVGFVRRRNHFRKLENILEQLDQRFLLGELMPDTFSAEDRLYKGLIKRSNKSVIEQLRRAEEERRDYKEYIESWVHEIKAPLTSIALICENRRKSGEDGRGREKEDFRAIDLESQRVENYVEMALYFARSKQVYKDYFIRKIHLEPVVVDVVTRNRLLCIQNQVRVEVDCKEEVYSDDKWIGFIIHQLLLNSIKYKKENAQVSIYTRKIPSGCVLAVKDNGIGILKEELPRIFEKGFTGSNGRNNRYSTGMGLYLCRKLCEKLGIQIRAESEYGQGTTIYLEFPISRYIQR